MFKFFTQKRVMVMVLLLLGLGVYSQLNNAQFLNKDIPRVLGNPLIQEIDLSHFVKNSKSLGDIVPNISYAIDRYYFGMNAKAFHWTNIFLHIVNAILIFLLMGRISKNHAKTSEIAALGAVLFCVHPLLSESVAYITMRPVLLRTLFIILGLGLHIRLRESSDKGRWLLYGCVVLLWIASLGSGAHILLMPILILSWEWLLKNSFRKILSQWEQRHLILFMSISVVVFFMFYWGLNTDWIESVGEVNGEHSSVLASFKALLFSLGFQVWKWVVPLRLSVYYSSVQGYGMLLLGVIILPFSLFLMYRRTNEKSDIRFFLLWIVLVLTAAMNPYANLSGSFEYHFYLSSIGLCFLTAFAVIKGCSTPGETRILTSVLIAVLALLTFCRTTDWRNGESYWQDAVVNNSQDPMVKYKLGQYYLNNQQDVFAVDYFNQVLVLDPDNIEAHFDRAKVLFDREDYLSAMDDAERVLELNPEFKEGLNLRGLIHRAQGNSEQAIVDFTAAGDSEDYRLHRALAYGDIREFEKALADLNEVLEKNPKSLSAYINRGAVYSAMNQMDKSLDDFTMAMNLDPRNTLALQNRAAVHYIEQRYDLALLDFTQWSRLEPDNWIPIMQRAEVYINKEDWELALQDIEAVVKVEPSLIEAFSYRAFLYNKLERYDEALTDYTHLMDAMPNNAQLYKERGKVFLNSNDNSAAVSDFTQAISAKGDDSQNYFFRALAQYNLKQYQQAWDDLKKAESLGQDIDPQYFEKIKPFLTTK